MKTKYLLMDRVLIRNGSGNILIVAPHGHPLDDTNSDSLAQAIASYLNCDAIINHGWQRYTTNLNNINHCKTEPVRSEFLIPIQNIINSKSAIFSRSYVFLIHGMDDGIRNKFPDIDAIVGWGNGNPPKYTCSTKFKNDFIEKMNKNGLKTKESEIGGKFGAYNDANLAQHLKSPKTECLQVEIIGQKRKTADISIQTGKQIGKIIEEMLLL